MTYFCKEENKKQKENSPVHPDAPPIIGNDERILFIVVDPLEWNAEKNRLRSNAFDPKKLREGKQSVCRLDFSNKQEVEEKVIDKLLKNKPDRKFMGGLIAKCEDIRAIQISNPPIRAYCVIDDGSEEQFPSHAHIGFSEPIVQDKQFFASVPNSKVNAIANLKKAFNANEPGDMKLLSLDECFPQENTG